MAHQVRRSGVELDRDGISRSALVDRRNAYTFTGMIIVRYDVEVIEGRTKFTRTLINPARPKPVTEKIVQVIDTEAVESLENIK